MFRGRMLCGLMLGVEYVIMLGGISMAVKNPYC